MQSEQAGDEDGMGWIMPFAQMPSPRTATSHGTALGKFRVLVVGPRESGKTSLVRGVALLPEIVYMDDETPMMETFASTRRYPPWWGFTEGHLDRNVCFIEACQEQALDYLAQQACLSVQTTHRIWDRQSRVKVLESDGMTHVDVILYLLDGWTEWERMHYHQMDKFATVIPIIARSDLRTVTDVVELKEMISETTKAYAVSTKSVPMQVDASAAEDRLCLTSSDFPQLLDELFHGDQPARLRHAAARRLCALPHHPQSFPDDPLHLGRISSLATSGAAFFLRVLLAGAGIGGIGLLASQFVI